MLSVSKNYFWRCGAAIGPSLYGYTVTSTKTSLLCLTFSHLVKWLIEVGFRRGKDLQTPDRLKMDLAPGKLKVTLWSLFN